jgi:hypothetical protein
MRLAGMREDRAVGMWSSGRGDADRDVSGGCRLVGDVTSVQDPAGPWTHCPPRRAVHWLARPSSLETHVM